MLRRCRGGQTSQRATGGEQLHGGRAHLRRMSGAIPARAWTGFDGCGLGETPGVEAKLLWRSVEAGRR